MKHKRDRVQTGTSLYKVPILVMIGQYNNQDSWMYIRTPGCISGFLDVYQDPWMFDILDSPIMQDFWLKIYNVLYSKIHTIMQVSTIYIYIKQCL